jgi:hypothetical protein
MSMVFHVSFAINFHLKDEPYDDSIIFHASFLLQAWPGRACSLMSHPASPNA